MKRTVAKLNKNKRCPSPSLPINRSKLKYVNTPNANSILNVNLITFYRAAVIEKQPAYCTPYALHINGNCNASLFQQERSSANAPGAFVLGSSHVAFGSRLPIACCYKSNV